MLSAGSRCIIFSALAIALCMVAAGSDAQSAANIAGRFIPEQTFAATHQTLMQQAEEFLDAASESAPSLAPAAKSLTVPSPSAVQEVLQVVPDKASTINAARQARLQPVIGPILEQEGIPVQFAAVAMVESAGDPAALSAKGARGLWQLMPETARRYGLEVNSRSDERLDIVRSTHAAAHYLRDLHDEFGSWPLALAAYNTGERNVQRAIEKSRSRDFLTLSSLHLLPLETRDYVPAVLARMPFFGPDPRSVLNPRKIVSAPVVFALNFSSTQSVSSR